MALAINLVILALAINFANAAESNRKCATLYNAEGYQGTPYSIDDGVKQRLSYMNCDPSSVHIEDGCFLTTFDIFGDKEIVDRNLTSVTWSALDAVCCECDGCSGAASRLEPGSCAKLFENPRCDSCTGFSLDMKDGDNARNFGFYLNNRMVSLAVKKGCTLTVFDLEEFGGLQFNFTDSTNMIGENLYRQISSARCECSGVQPTTPRPSTTTVPSTTSDDVYITY